MLALPLLLLVASASALRVHERRSVVPSGFRSAGSAPAGHTLNLRIALQNNNLKGLEDALMDAATPGSANFRQWLSKGQVEAFSRPTEETVNVVNAWLAEHDVTAGALTPSGDWISLSVPVEKANSMLGTTFETFVHDSTGTEIVRTLEYSLPENVAPHVKLVHPTVAFTRPLRSGPVITFPQTGTAHGAASPVDHADSGVGALATVPAACNTTITPACLQALYSVPVRVSSTTSPSKIAVAGFSNQFANQADLTTFLRNLRPDMPSNTSFTVLSVDNGQNTQSRPGIEANLDMQYAIGMSGGLPTTFVSVGPRTRDGADEGFLDIINAMLALSDPPQSFTTSYGFNTEGDLAVGLTTAMCDSFMQLTARGVSVMYASGDGGVAAAPGETCTNFLASFPTCPFVTMVGATENVNPERGAELSAGGFSNIFSQPSFQSTAVAGYLAQLGNQFAGRFNRTGRAYPDVAAQGERVEIILSGRAGTVGGTSCSSPILSGIIGLLNEELIAAGKPVLGFLNPWFYANPQMFNDITTGSNPGCNTNGFPALTGWDPVTGLGTPNYVAMRAAAGL
ncbi:subtilisin-like protein [Auricularia subglabra TFB-10046 SS5]|nr:subtilisin-like protein [Auricularia subglabra TFB-10046 SS5]